MFIKIQKFSKENIFLIPIYILIIISLSTWLSNIHSLLKIEVITYVFLIGILSSHYIKKNIYKISYKKRQYLINCYFLVFISLFLLIFNGYLFIFQPKSYVKYSIVVSLFLLPFLLDILFSLTKSLWCKVIIGTIFIVNFCVNLVLLLMMYIALMMNPLESFLTFLFLPSLLSLIIMINFFARWRLKKNNRNQI